MITLDYRLIAVTMVRIIRADGVSPSSHGIPTGPAHKEIPSNIPKVNIDPKDSKVINYYNVLIRGIVRRIKNTTPIYQ